MPSSDIYPSNHEERRIKEPPSTRLLPEEYRSNWRKDYARVLHSASFRRLQGKNQLLPSTDSDFFRNRITHSLEVAQIAHSIAIRLNANDFKAHGFKVCTDLCQTAALCHDIGHPPFGHQGEKALNVLMQDYGGFEGNAQSFRILAKLEKKFQSSTPENDENRYGLNLTYRTLAAIVKYDGVIPDKLDGGKKEKGIYGCDAHILSEIKAKLGVAEKEVMRTIECQIMDIADDIAYSTYDLEDVLKGEFLSPMSILFPPPEVITTICRKVSETKEISDLGIVVNYDMYNDVMQELFATVLPPSCSTEDLSSSYLASQMAQSNCYYRTQITSYLVGMFIRGISIESIDAKRPWLSKLKVDSEIRLKIELLKKVILESIIENPKMHARNSQAENMIKKMFRAIKAEPHLMPVDSFETYQSYSDKTLKHRVICDFISGMTDKYAFGFYKRLFDPSNKSFFEPHW